MSTALRVEGVSKQYRIYDRPSDRLLEALSRGRLKRHREFWALRDVSFEVERGTTVGIIGPNGCGKSTLLQIIAGTLDPTHGQVWREGRVAALLELGAGFNPEFTGIENVFMSAALMGFSRRETEALLPSIERFAEIGDFIHQPVKTYSSGMYVRLAFAVAVSVDPELLLVDEALAVGDAIFQHRCMRRIRQMQERGTTILFVSHDMSAVRAICSKVIFMNDGRIENYSSATEAIGRYQKLVMEQQKIYEIPGYLMNKEDNCREFEIALRPGAIRQQKAPPHNGSEGQLVSAKVESIKLNYGYRHGDGRAEILRASLTDLSGQVVRTVETGAPVKAYMKVLFHQNVHHPVFGFLIRNKHGVHAYGLNSEQREIRLGIVSQGEVVEVEFDFECWLSADAYSVSFAVHSDNGISYDWLDDVFFFNVTSDRYIEGIANLNARVNIQRHRTRLASSL